MIIFYSSKCREFDNLKCATNVGLTRELCWENPQQHRTSTELAETPYRFNISQFRESRERLHNVYDGDTLICRKGSITSTLPVPV